MRLRSFLLAGAVLPLTMGYPALALERAPSRPLVLAQAEEQPCPEGETCPPAADQQPATEEGKKKRDRRKKAEEQQQQQEQQQGEQQQQQEQPQQQAAPEEQPATEEAAPANDENKKKRDRRKNAEQQQQQQQQETQQQQQEQPQQETQQQPQEQPQQVEEQPAPEQEQAAPDEKKKKKKNALQRALERQQQLLQQGQQQEQVQPQQEQAQPQQEQGQPQEEQAQQPRKKKRDQQQQQQQEQAQTPSEQTTPPAEEQPSVVEQQLEAQGDKKEAKKVRTLRDLLLQQLEQAVGGESQPTGQDTNTQRDRKRQGDHNRRQDNQDTASGDNRDESPWRRDRDQNDVVERRGGRIIIDLGGGNLSVESDVPDEGGRLLYGADDVEVQNLPHGFTRTIVHRPNGVDIVTVRDRFGDIVKRSRVLPNGHEIVLIDNRYDNNNNEVRRPQILHDVPPPRVRIPRDRYIVDLGRASDADIRGALLAPPVQAPPRAYTLDEVLQNQDVRAYSPRIDLDTITFDFGSATISDSQMGALYALGQAMEDVIAENPDEVYLIEGHTDKVGSDYDNLILSDERAEAVATALSQNFNIPPENLVTEGYGEQFPKIDTEGPERRNRRATVRRLTELLQAEGQ